MEKIKIFVIFAIITFCSLSSFVSSAEEKDVPTIMFRGENGTQTLNLEQLKKTFRSREVSTFNLNTNRIEIFYAFSMDNIFHKFWKTIQQRNNFVKVECSDGYVAYIEASKFRANQSFLAFAKKGSHAFTTMGPSKDKAINLGNFFLVWKESYKKGRATRRRHHWPWKVEKISLIDELPDSIKPTTDSSINTNWGYLNYVKQCLPCHSLNGFGGNIGPDLMTYSNWKTKSDKWLKKFISHPKKIDPDSRMPPFPTKIDIRETRINNIVLYLRHLTSSTVTDNTVKAGMIRKRKRYSHKELLKKLK